MKSTFWLVHGSLLLVAIIYGANYTIAKSLMPDVIGPSGFIVIRILGALFFMLIYHKIWVKEKVTNFKDYLLLFVCAFFGVALNMLMFFHGLSLTSPVDASLIMVTNPILVLLLGWFMKEEQITWIKTMGVIIGAIGAILLISGNIHSDKASGFMGNLMIAINAASYAVYLVIVRPLFKRYHPMTIMVWTFIFGFIIVAPFGWSEFTSIAWHSLDATQWSALSFVVIGSTFLAYTLNGWALSHVKSSTVGSYVYLQPVFGVFIAVVLGRYELHFLQVLYALFIFAGVFLVGLRQGKKINSL